MAGMAVSAAEPSGLFGMLQESFATGKLLVQATSDTTANELVKAVAADYATAEGRKAASEGLKAKLGGGQPGDIKAKALDALGQAATLVAAKAPGDAAAYRAWLPRSARTWPRPPRKVAFWLRRRAGERRREGDPGRNLDRAGLTPRGVGIGRRGCSRPPRALAVPAEPVAATRSPQGLDGVPAPVAPPDQEGGSLAGKLSSTASSMAPSSRGRSGRSA